MNVYFKSSSKGSSLGSRLAKQGIAEFIQLTQDVFANFPLPRQPIMYNDFPDKMTRRQAAEYLCVAYTTLKSWAHLRIGPPYYRTGKKVIYFRRDLDSWLESRRVLGEVQYR